MAVDFYAELRAIIEGLSRAGYAAEARTLQEAMDAGSTSNEIMMAVRWHLRQIGNVDELVELGTERPIRDLLNELDRLLA